MSKSMILKLFLITAFVLSTMASAADGKKVRWRLAETWGPNFPVFGDASKNMAKLDCVRRTWYHLAIQFN